jgi:hypothetical protein
MKLPCAIYFFQQLFGQLVFTLDQQRLKSVAVPFERLPSVEMPPNLDAVLLATRNVYRLSPTIQTVHPFEHRDEYVSVSHRHRTNGLRTKVSTIEIDGLTELASARHVQRFRTVNTHSFQHDSPCNRSLHQRFHAEDTTDRHGMHGAMRHSISPYITRQWVSTKSTTKPIESLTTLLYNRSEPRSAVPIIRYVTVNTMAKH